MPITLAQAVDRPAIEQLLTEAKLPVADLPANLSHFLVLTDAAKQPIGAIGLEVYPPYGLLRSAVIQPGHHGRGYGKILVQELMAHARKEGLEQLFLLTETAAGFFAQLGFEEVTRDSVPEAIRASSQFSLICPSSATVMQYTLRP